MSFRLHWVLVALISFPAAAMEGHFADGIAATRQGKAAEAKAAFVKGCDAGETAACQRAGRPVDTAKLAGVAVLQGATTEASTQLAILQNGEERLETFLWDQEGNRLIEPASTDVKSRKGSPWRVMKVRYEGLEKGRPYILQVVLPSKGLVDLRKLRALDSGKRSGRLAIASCMDDGYDKEQKEMWPAMLDHNPDLILLIGDNVYTDSRPWGSKTDPAILWRRYAETREALKLFRAENLVPILGTWDDHDYGANDGDRTYRYRKEAVETFAAFFAQEAMPGFIEKGPGVASVISAFGQRFFLLDNRFFRSPVGDKDETHWGKEQEDWLWKGLLLPGPVAWLIQGDQFFGAYHKFESYEGRHPKSFRSVLEKLRTVSNPVLFVSGDRHLTELMEIPADVLGYRTYELTSSGIHAKTFPDAWKVHPNPRHIAGASGVINYMIVESEAGPPLRATVTAYGPGKVTLFTKKLEVKK